MLGGYEEHIALAFAGDFDGRQEEGLGVDRPVDLEGAQFAELFHVDGLGSEYRFGERGAGAEVVVLRGGDLSERGSGQENGEGGAAERSHVESFPI